MRFALLLTGLLALSACGAKSVWAPDAQVQKARYTHNAPTSVSLITTKNVGSGNGAHTALLVNASERVLFDPAGSMSHPNIPERNDVIMGANPAVVDYFIDFQTRKEFFTTVQTVDVPPTVAEDLLRRVKAHGAVAGAMCTSSTSALLRATPGFESLGRAMFPTRLEDNFATLANVRTVEFRDPVDSEEKWVLYNWVGQVPRYAID
ncbi:MAG: hypothetical protein ACPGRD_00335 [Planktomarina sp.]